MQPDFAEVLRAKGNRATQGRIELLRVLFRANRPLSIAEIRERLSGPLDTVTLYRALSALAHEGVILRGSGSGAMRAAHFSYPKSAHHHHLVCADCGFIKTCTNCS